MILYTIFSYFLKTIFYFIILVQAWSGNACYVFFSLTKLSYHQWSVSSELWWITLKNQNWLCTVFWASLSWLVIKSMADEFWPTSLRRCASCLYRDSQNSLLIFHTLLWNIISFKIELIKPLLASRQQIHPGIAACSCFPTVNVIETP